MYSFDSVSRSHVGNVRTGNEDSCFASDEMGLYIVADGMGGHNGGEVASALCVRTVLLCLAEKRPPYDPADLQSALQEANRAVFSLGTSDEELLGMGTTADVLNLTKTVFHLLHVGDSTSYLFRNKGLRKLTKDHTTLQQMRDLGISLGPEGEENFRHGITRCIGYDKQVEIDSSSGELMPGDVFLLCSDGITDLMNDAEILEILSGNAEIGDALDMLVESALERGGHDNITAVIVRANIPDDKVKRRLKDTTPHAIVQ